MSCQCEGGFYDALKPANDTAVILMNGTGQNGGGGGGGDDGDGGAGGGDGRGLPITGIPAAGIAVVGGLLLAAGTGAFLAARHRRARFVA